MKRYRAYEGIPAPYDKRKRHVVPSALRSSDSSLTGNSASSEGSPMRSDGNTSTSSPLWRLSARSKPPCTIRRSVPIWRSKPRPHHRSLPRWRLRRPFLTNTELTVFNRFGENGEDDDDDDDDLGERIIVGITVLENHSKRIGGKTLKSVSISTLHRFCETYLPRV